jgi:hypothetical protein
MGRIRCIFSLQPAHALHAFVKKAAQRQRTHAEWVEISAAGIFEEQLPLGVQRSQQFHGVIALDVHQARITTCAVVGHDDDRVETTRRDFGVFNLTFMIRVSSTPDHERHCEGVESPRG